MDEAFLKFSLRAKASNAYGLKAPTGNDAEKSSFGRGGLSPKLIGICEGESSARLEFEEDWVTVLERGCG